MNQLTPDELKDILDKHAKWLQKEEGGEQADLKEANLEGANLAGANLEKADLAGAVGSASRRVSPFCLD